MEKKTHFSIPLCAITRLEDLFMLCGALDFLLHAFPERVWKGKLITDIVVCNWRKQGIDQEDEADSREG